MSQSLGPSWILPRASYRGQGTVEYLVIIAVVVVLSLVVVGIISSLGSGSAGTVSTTASKLSQSTNSISINDAVVDNDGNGILSLTNNSGGSLTISKINFGGVDSNYNVNLVQGDKRSFGIPSVGSVCSCVGFTGTNKTCNLIVYATSEYGVSKTFTIPITINCVNDAIASNPAALVQVTTVTTTTLPDVGPFSEPLAQFARDGNTSNQISSSDSMVTAVTSDDQNNIYVTGYFGGTSLTLGNGVTLTNPSYYVQIFVAKYNSSGVVQWAQTATPVGTENNNFSYSVAVDGAHNVYIGGRSYGRLDFGNGVVMTNTAYQDYFVVKYNSSGVAQWVAYPANNSGAAGEIHSIKLDSMGNIYAVGYGFATTLDFGNGVTFANKGSTDFFLVKYNSSGVAQWVRTTQAGSGTGADNGIAVDIDSSGNLYVGGYGNSATLDFGNGVTLANQGSYDFFIVKYNSSGVAQWAKNSIGTNWDQLSGLAVDINGNVLITGYSRSNPLGFGNSVSVANQGNLDYFVAKYDSSGTAQWVNSTLNGTGNEYGYGVASDKYGDIYVAGIVDGNVDFGNGALLLHENPSATFSGFLLKYSSSGTTQWVKNPIDLGSGDGYNSVYVDLNGNLYGGGYHIQALDFGDGVTIPAHIYTGKYSPLLVKYKQN
ncbi:MAG: SBBP repeat-containing protein [archaeon]|jgi:hypothetical protein